MGREFTKSQINKILFMSAFCGLLLNPFTSHAGTSEKPADRVKGDFAAAAYQIVKTPFQIAGDVLDGATKLRQATDIFGDNETLIDPDNLPSFIPHAPIPTQILSIVEAMGDISDNVQTALTFASPPALAVSSAQKVVFGVGQDIALGIKNHDFGKRIRQRSGNILKNLFSMPGKVIGTVSGTTANAINRVGDASQAIADALDGNSLTRPLSYPFTGLKKGFRVVAWMANIPNMGLACLKDAQVPTSDQEQANRPTNQSPTLMLHYER